MRLVMLLSVILFPRPASANQCDGCFYRNVDCRFAGALDKTQHQQTCNTEKANSPICQREACGGSGTLQKETRAATCRDNANCFSNSSRAQNNGIDDLRQQNKELRDFAEKSRSRQANAIESANGILSRWDASLRRGDQTNGSRSDWENDRRLVNQALKDFESPGKFPESIPKGAQNRSIRRELSNYYEAKLLETAHDDQEKQNLEAISRLRDMNKRTEARREGIGSVAPNQAAASAKPSGGENFWNLGVAEKPADPLATGGDGKKGEKGSNITSSADMLAKYPERAKEKDLSAEALREKLRRGLAHAGKKPGGDAGDEKEGKAALGTGATPLPDTGEKADLEGFVATAKSEAGFGMNASDTEREVRRLTRGLAGADAGASEGVLGEESADLFQRVHQAHKHCLATECVALR